MPGLQQPQGLLAKLGLVESQSRVPRQMPISLNGRNSAAATAAVKSFGEVRLPGIARQSAKTEPELAESSDEVWPSWSTANGSAAATAAFKSAGEGRPPSIAKQSATTEHELAFFRFSDPEEAARTVIEQQRDHLPAEAKSEILKQ